MSFTLQFPFVLGKFRARDDPKTQFLQQTFRMQRSRNLIMLQELVRSSSETKCVVLQKFAVDGRVSAGLARLEILPPLPSVEVSVVLSVSSLTDSESM